MVEKKRRKIAKKPQTGLTPDNWVADGGLDPEINSSGGATTLVSEKVTEKPVPQTKETGEKSFPHRISFDLGKSQYKRLKFASFDGDRPMNSIIRGAVEEWMSSRNY